MDAGSAFHMDALMEHLSRLLHTIVRWYSSEGRLINMVCERYDLYESPDKDFESSVAWVGELSTPDEK